jgi:ketosteroid isomerase-like protein
LTVKEWIETYERAWNERDDSLAASLFTEDGVYCSHLLQPPAIGQEGVAEYWRTVTATQSEVDARLGEPIQSGSKVAVEFWTRMKNAGEPVTVAGCMLLRMANDGRCEELREYWFFEPADHAPPEIWGR